LSALPDFTKNALLHSVELRNVTLLRDLAPLTYAPALSELRVEGLPQLQVADFQPLRACTTLRSLTVDVGSKTKSREVYKMLRAKA